MKYEKEIEFLKSIESPDRSATLYQNKREVYSKKQIEKLRKEHPQIPEEYIEYLSEIGEGSFREEFCTIFGELCEIEDFYDESLLEFLEFEERVLQFGCDPSGKALVF